MTILNPIRWISEVVILVYVWNDAAHSVAMALILLTVQSEMQAALWRTLAKRMKA